MIQIKEEKLKNIGLFVLRLAVGIIFVVSGWGKLTGMESTISVMENVGLPGAVFWAYLVALVEFLGGLAVIIGVYLRCFAKLLAIIMLVALLTVKIEAGFKAARIDIMLLSANIALASLGGGDWQLLKNKECFGWCRVGKEEKQN